MEDILVVDNQMSICELLQRFLSKKGYAVETTMFGKQALGLLKKKFYQIIICDYYLRDMDGTMFFEEAIKFSPDSKIIFTTGQVNLRNAVELIRRGAYHYLAKPLNQDELMEILKACSADCSGKNGQRNTANGHAQVAKPKVNTKANNGTVEYIFGESKAAKRMLSHVKKVGATNYTVILEGETGTGKESLARLIHNESPRNGQPFIPIDCDSLSKDLAGSELFGHEKGAFTGAVTNKVGVFEIAQGGTVFLDEIANLSLDTQMALLRALQEKVIRKIGSVKEIPIDVRIITATNEDLQQKSEGSNFREDLYFRLSEFILKVPPLRDRMEDLQLFMDFFLENTANELGIAKAQFSNEVLEYFYKYPWPGNIRELKNMIRRACLFVSEDNVIYNTALPANIVKYWADSRQAQPLDHSDSHSPTDKMEVNGHEDLKTFSHQAETQKIMMVLQEVHFNKTKAAEKLNIHRKTLYSKLKQLNIPY